MDSLFRTHKDITDAEYKILWEKGLFFFDANVLLDLYRLPENAQKDLLAILSDNKINSRIWLPFQASLEYTYNKIEAISDQKGKFNSVKKIIDEFLAEIENSRNGLTAKIAELQLKKRHSVIDPDPYVNDQLFQGPVKILNEFLDQLSKLDKKQPDVTDQDIVKEKVSALFENKIGGAPTKEFLENIYKVGEERYKENVPPGYKDKAKDGFYMFEDRKFIRRFGDLIVWKEIIEKCNKDKIEYIILVTGDVKEDWWQEKRGKRIGPKYELLNEIYYEAKSVKLFHMYDTPSFMKYSKEYLKINVKDQSIAETKDLLEFTKTITDINILLTNVPTIRSIVQSVIAAYQHLILHYTSLNPLMEKLLVPRSKLEIMLHEIYSNVFNYSSDRIVYGRFFKTAKFVVLRFRNRINSEQLLNNGDGKGLRLIKDTMKPYGKVKVTVTPTYYKIALFFERDYFAEDVKITL